MLNIKNLQKYFKDFKLEPISLELETGMVLGIFGANGSGKTTLIQCLTKELVSDGGSVLFNGQIEYRDVMSYMPSYFPYDTYPTVKSVVNFHKRLYPKFDESLAIDTLNKFGISLKDRPKKISLGTKQKLMLALVLASNAKLIILDEPTEGIDLFLRDEIFQTLQDYLYDKDVTLIIATHEIESYTPLIDKVLYLEEGHPLIVEDAISFESVATQFIKEDVSSISLKDFAYLRQKEVTYDQSHKSNTKAR